MSNQFKTDVATMAAKADTVRNVAEQINGELDKMVGNVRGGLAGRWAGQAHDGFQLLMNRYEERQKQMYKLLVSYSDTVRQNGVAYDRVEQANREAMSGLLGALN